MAEQPRFGTYPLGEMLAEFAIIDARLRVARELGGYERGFDLPNTAWRRHAGLLESSLTQEQAKAIRLLYLRTEELRARVVTRTWSDPSGWDVRDKDGLDEILTALSGARQALEKGLTLESEASDG